MITRLLVALDESQRAPGVFDAAAEIALRFCAQLHPFRVITIPPEFPPAAAGSRADALPEYLVGVALRELEELARRAPRVAVAAPVVRFGQPWRSILEMSDAIDAHLIVIGSHGYRPIDRLLGTTAAQVVNRAHRDVLVVHADRTTSTLGEATGSPYRQSGDL